MIELLAYLIIDGDNLRAGSLDLRLWGIDAPEISTPEGVAAKHVLIALTSGKTITCEPMGLGPYGRTIARCYADGADLGCVMVSSGYAFDWPKYSSGYYRECAN